MDIEYEHLDKYKDIPGLYDKYIKEHWKSDQRLLATALTAADAIKIYEAHPDIIRGFGEFKLYDHNRDKKLNYKRLSIIREVCKYQQKNGLTLPIYIHYTIESTINVRALGKLLYDYCDIPIVLCHCGMGPRKTADELAWVYGQVAQLMNEHPNLWIDISFSATDFFDRNRLALYNLPNDRIVTGTDFNILTFTKKQDTELIKHQFDERHEYLNFDRNVRRLFAMGAKI
jgi:predicted TIM-barrel fold metal-dependent hydrolase